MQFRLQFDVDNAAFDDDLAVEIAATLASIADEIEDAGEVPTKFKSIFDVNGNRIGQYALK